MLPTWLLIVTMYYGTGVQTMADVEYIPMYSREQCQWVAKRLIRESKERTTATCMGTNLP